MSQPATERTAPAPAAGGNVLTRKIGPLPGWAWAGIAVAAGVGYIWWRNRQNAAAAAATDTGTATTDPGVDQSATDAVLQSEIQNLQGEVSTPAPTPNSPAPKTEKVKVLVVPRAETLAKYAKANKWNAATLKAVEALNGLSASSRLKKGQRLVRPVNKEGIP